MSAYNKLVGQRNQYKNSFAQIDVQLKRRHDLVPNLVETAKAYMKHERETLEAVIAARNQAISASSTVASNPENTSGLKELVAAEEGAAVSAPAMTQDAVQMRAAIEMRQPFMIGLTAAVGEP